MKKIMILNGPNLNMLGTREPSIYGNQTINDIEKMCHDTANELDYEVTFRQSNYEGQLVEWVQEAFKENYEGFVINAAAYTAVDDAETDESRKTEGEHGVWRLARIIHE